MELGPRPGPARVRRAEEKAHPYIWILLFLKKHRDVTVVSGVDWGTGE